MEAIMSGEIIFELLINGAIVGYEKHKYIPNVFKVKESSIYIFHSHTGHPLSWKCIHFDEKNYLKHDSKNLVTYKVEEK